MRSHLSHLLHPLLLCLSNWLRETQHLSCCHGNGMRDCAWTARWWGTRFELMGILCLHLSPVTGFRTGFPQFSVLFLILYKDTASPASVENTETCKKREAGENRIVNHARLQDFIHDCPKEYSSLTELRGSLKFSQIPANGLHFKPLRYTALQPSSRTYLILSSHLNILYHHSNLFILGLTTNYLWISHFILSYMLANLAPFI